MALLNLNGSPVPIQLEPVDGEPVIVGDEAEAFDGTYLTRRRGLKETWGPLRTPPLNGADITNYRALLRAAPPHAATGDLTGTKSVIVTGLRERLITLAGASRWVSFEFTLREE
jgi:hypothetical protein